MAEPVADIVAALQAKYPERDAAVLVVVDVESQQLHLILDQKIQRSYPISTSRYGLGSASGSNKTPLGAHYVKRKYGKNAAPLTIFKGRQNTGKIAEIETRPQATNDDWVTTRILWLSGLEEGKNSGPGVDSYQRYIYIHGTHEEGLIGQPASHGCIRMLNADVVELFTLVPKDSLVYIAKDLTNELT